MKKKLLIILIIIIIVISCGLICFFIGMNINKESIKKLYKYSYIVETSTIKNPTNNKISTFQTIFTFNENDMCIDSITEKIFEDKETYELYKSYDSSDFKKVLYDDKNNRITYIEKINYLHKSDILEGVKSNERTSEYLTTKYEIIN